MLQWGRNLAHYALGVEKTLGLGAVFRGETFSAARRLICSVSSLPFTRRASSPFKADDFYALGVLTFDIQKVRKLSATLQRVPATGGRGRDSDPRWV